MTRGTGSPNEMAEMVKMDKMEESCGGEAASEICWLIRAVRGQEVGEGCIDGTVPEGAPMSQASRHRSLTPSIEIQHLTDPLLSVHRRFKSRSYSSAEELTITANKSKSSSSTPSVKTIVSDDTPLLNAAVPDAPSVPIVETPPNPVGTKRQMFAQYFNFNRAATARPEVSGTETVAGDFDNTPIPSARPSFEETVVLAPGKGMASTLSSASKSAAGHRHALLKSQPGRTMEVDRDPPVPPILSREPSTDTVPFLRAHSPETSEATPMVADERARSLRATESPSPDRIPIGPPRNPYDRQERMCIDPALHTTESHSKVHHPGLLEGADFCDAGTSGQLAQQTSLPLTESGIVSSTSSEPEILLVQHAEHSRATKVRPAADLKPFYHHENLNQGQQSHPAVSKVAPFDASREEEHVSEVQSFMETSSGEDISNMQTALVPEKISRRVSVAHPDGRTEATAYHQLEDSGVSVPCLDHQHLSKVQPFQDDADVSSQDKYFAIGSDDSLHKDEHDEQVRASPSAKSTATKGAALDYRRTAKWLRDLLLNRDGYSAALTERPERAESMPRGRGSNENTEPLPTASARRSMSPRSLTRESTLPPSKIEPGAFKHAVHEMERLLDEALAVACQIVDHQEATQQDSVKSPLLSNPETRGARTFPNDDTHTNLETIDLEDLDDFKKRNLMGISLGFSSMNFHSMLTDLFGASLMSGNPHQEVVDEHDVRRHGGGLGAWLGIWTWCWIGSLSIGFLLGAAIIDGLRPAWGFYLSIILIVITLLLNTICPEVRRSAFRRSVAEVRTETAISRRLARGEVMMHRMKTGPKWWGQEVWHGALLSLEMLCQPGFAIMAIYVGWIYAQVVLIILFLGSLSSRFYRMRSPFVGLMVATIALGALVGIPFQKANIFSRARHREQNTSRMTLDNRFLWTSHLLRRTIFAIGLPLAGLIYTMVSEGPPMHPSVPAIIAALIGFLSCLAISECNGFIMETFDTSDLQPGMIGHSREESATSKKRTNYSSFPRVSAGLALCHTFAFVFAAGASTLGGLSLRNLGQRAATGVVAGILFVLTLLLLIGLIRFKEVQIIPACKSFEMDRWTEVRRKSLHRRASMPEGTPRTDDAVAEDEPWRPIVIGNPVAKTRRVNILELGPMTRWTEIRRKNKLVDANVSTGRAALDVVRDVRELVSRSPSQRSVTESTRRGHLHRSGGSGGSNDMELDNLRRQAASTSANSHHSWATADPYVERECVLGQTVREEQEEEEPSYVKSDTSADEVAAEQYSSRMRSGKVRPMYQGPPKGKGKGD
ncbi:hypothetical protein BN1708_004168 [Verticillium longisporum]|uniref:Polyamine transport protein n=1 Tax=Verticillium longisporum TaxID=100787 RepID=A0A0G4LWV9_VERLO|nr:hypothetical protein BN1708_004168 [Verticillium longisporum]